MTEEAKPALGLRHNSAKPPLGLISNDFLVETAKVLEFGRKKYAAHNWRKGLKWQDTIDCALRHLNAFNAGEDIDPESGLSHLGHLACNVMFLCEFLRTHPELDDRYKNQT